MLFHHPSHVTVNGNNMWFSKDKLLPNFSCVYISLKPPDFCCILFFALLLNDFYHLMSICPVYSMFSPNENGKMHILKENLGCLSHCKNIGFLGKCGSDRVTYSANILFQFFYFPFHLCFSLLYALHILLRKQTYFAVQRLDRMRSYEKTSEHV